MKKIILLTLLLISSVNSFADGPILPCIYVNQRVDKNISFTFYDKNNNADNFRLRNEGTWLVPRRLKGALKWLDIYYDVNNSAQIYFPDDSTFYGCIITRPTLNNGVYFTYYPVGTRPCTYELFDNKGCKS